MSSEARTIEEIRGEIASERAELEQSLADFRAGLEAKRKPATVVVGVLVVAVATLGIARVVRRIAFR